MPTPFDHEIGLVHSAEPDRYQKWAKWLINQRLRPAVEQVPLTGWGTCIDGSPYDLDNFLADTLAGDVPWGLPEWFQVHDFIVADPEWWPLETRFRELYGQKFWCTEAEFRIDHPQEDRFDIRP